MGNKSVENPPVEEGQVWRDNDPRSDGRLIRVDSISNGYIRVIGVQSGVKTRVSKSRFSRSSAHRGFSLVAQPAPAAVAQFPSVSPCVVRPVEPSAVDATPLAIALSACAPPAPQV